ncbi:hypothetical protein Q0601_00580 [Paracoccus onubensis]|uniref:hypothetical protein n=1 Tax=Paracoccus onubensis TaxID=1675788 RepID=UPI002730CBBB|nr:hypothetical protein [Paracoccus onubensis]MDP0925657.1 hypothetical protein [Paracoccus onubensis]
MGSSGTSNTDGDEAGIEEDVQTAAAGADDESDAEASCPCPKWKYEIGANHIGGALGREYYHLFVRVTDLMNLSSPTYRAGPSADGQPAISGVIMGTMTPDSVVTPNEDYESSDDELSLGYILPTIFNNFPGSLEDTGVAIFGEAVILDKDHNLGLTQHSQEIADKKIKYVPTGPNSNSYATTIVNEEGIGAEPPDCWAPGAGVSLL